MICLEELILSLDVIRSSTSIDENHLKNEIVICLPELRIFQFNIMTHCQYLNNEIFSTFNHWKYGQVNSYISYYPNNIAQSHIFSLPGLKNVIYRVTYGFLGGFCENIRILYLVDHVYPFEHEFFLRISRSFPLITHLTVLSNRLRNHINENNDQIDSVVEFPHLTSLRIHYQRDIYLEQFLNYTKTHLPNLLDLTISYRNLLIVTENYQRDITRRNCSKVEILSFTIRTDTEHSNEFYSYFPCLKELL
ncbi:hypothetical protein I4U23_004971 [Adineta vaga]|nr:hypothetical protein I4U23_004971 [Adineta vaga]